MVKSGDLVKWRMPLDQDYSYGKILSIDRGIARVVHTGGYYDGIEIDVYIKFIEKGGNESGYKVKRRR